MAVENGPWLLKKRKNRVALKGLLFAEDACAKFLSPGLWTSCVGQYSRGSVGHFRLESFCDANREGRLNYADSVRKMSTRQSAGRVGKCRDVSAGMERWNEKG